MLGIAKEYLQDNIASRPLQTEADTMRVGEHVHASTDEPFLEVPTKLSLEAYTSLVSKGDIGVCSDESYFDSLFYHA
jgi:hypothetical protein